MKNQLTKDDYEEMKACIANLESMLDAAWVEKRKADYQHSKPAIPKFILNLYDTLRSVGELMILISGIVAIISPLAIFVIGIEKTTVITIVSILGTILACMWFVVGCIYYRYDLSRTREEDAIAFSEINSKDSATNT